MDIEATVYIVLVNFNSYNDTIECVESLLKSEFKNFKIIIIDNSPTDIPSINLLDWFAGNSDLQLQTHFEDIVFPLQSKPISSKILSESQLLDSKYLHDEQIIIARSFNRGFAAANNVAFKYILNCVQSNAMIWILNNDTIVRERTLTNLVSAYQSSGSEKYIYGNKLMYYHQPNIIQAVAGRYDIWLGRSKHIGEGEIDYGQYDSFVYNASKYDYIVGASIFTSTDFVRKAGLMCEDYFLYFEELDWMQTAQLINYKMKFVNDAIVYHKEGASTKGNKHIKSNIADFYSITSRVKFIKKWYPRALYTVLMGVNWALLKRLFNGQFQLVFKAATEIRRIVAGHLLKRLF